MVPNQRLIMMKINSLTFYLLKFTIKTGVRRVYNLNFLYFFHTLVLFLVFLLFFIFFSHSHLIFSVFILFYILIFFSQIQTLFRSVSKLWWFCWNPGRYIVNILITQVMSNKILKTVNSSKRTIKISFL